MFYSTFSLLNLYVYVDNNPLKYIDPTGHVKVIPADISLADYEIDVLSPIEGTFASSVLGLTILLRSIVLGSIFNAPAIFVIPKY
jgi:hypothetical protein